MILFLLTESVIAIGMKFSIDYEKSPIFPQGISGASQTRARVKITPRENRRHAAGREKNACRLFSWGDCHARSRFARSTIPEEKWGTTRSLSLALRTVFNLYFLQLKELPV